MRYHLMKSQDIRLNLATEEYLMKTVDCTEPLLLLYIQKPCVIIGRNQNAYEELNQSYLRKHDVVCTRRISGGGAVYDDLGNVSFSFVSLKNAVDFGDYRGGTAPILAALRAMGATNAVSAGRNDLYINGMKFSGNAMYTKKERMYTHGTLMYDVDLSVLDQVLTKSKDAFISKATPSNRKSVGNIRPFLDERYQFQEITDFRDALLCQIYKVDSLEDIKDKELSLTKQDEAAIQQLYVDRYANDEWIYGQAPAFAVRHRTRIPLVGLVDVQLSTNHGRITELRIYGDFFGVNAISELEQKLIGQAYTYQGIKEALNGIVISDYFLHLTKEQFLKLVMGEE